MRLEIAPLRREHFTAAAAVLAARHRADRAHRPELPAEFEDEAAARRALRDVLLRWTGGGLVALRRGHVVGYLVATLRAQPPPSLDALHPDPRAALVSIAGHAVDPAGDPEVYQQLYTAIAPRWLAGRYPAHYIDLPATGAEALETWQALGFARETVVAVRHTGPIPGMATSPVNIRRAGLEDLEAVTRLADALARYHAGPPVFAVYSAEATALVRQRQEALLADANSLVLLASRAGSAIGLLSMGPEAPLEPIATPQRSIYMHEGYSTPEARNIAVLGLSRALAWARELGYDYCLTAWHAPNYLSSRFLTAIGFRPLQVRLRRLVNEAGTLYSGEP